MKLLNSKRCSSLLIIIAITVISGCQSKSSDGNKGIAVGSEIELTGTIVCLPQEESKVATSECAFGLQVDSTYYRLKNIPREALKSGRVRAGNTVKVTGVTIKAAADSKYAASVAINTKEIQLLKADSSTESGLSRYTGKKFMINYPADWLKKRTESGTWSGRSSKKGAVLVVFRSSRQYLANTNFSYVQVVISKSGKQKAVKNCLSPLDVHYKSDKLTINGIEFSHIITSDAATGDRYRINSYRTIRNGKCWVIESILNYSPIEFYGKDSKVKEFNRKAIEERIKDIVQSFRFKQSSKF